MTRLINFFLTCAFLHLHLLSNGYSQPNPFTLEIVAPESVSGSLGQVVEFEAEVRLTRVDMNVQGWSLSVGVGNPSVCRFLSATTTGTVGAAVPDGLRDNGFEKTELIDANGTGAISAVVLSFTQPVVLASGGGPYTLLKLAVSATIPNTPESSFCTIQFVDGLQGSGQPVSNVITANSMSFMADWVNATIELKPNAEPTSTPTPTTEPDPTATFVGSRPFQLEISAPEVVSGSPGEVVEFEASVRLTRVEADVQAWSIGMGVENPAVCRFLSATTQGTVGDAFPIGLRDSGFEKTELIDANGTGVVSAVVLSFINPVVLTAGGGPYTLLRLNVSATIPSTPEPTFCRIQIVDGLQGSGRPVLNVITANSMSFTADWVDATIELTSSPDPTFTPTPTEPATETPTPSSTPPKAADLQVVISASSDSASVGENLTYTFQMTNLGPDSASGVALEDRFPSSVFFLSASPGCSYLGGVLTCSVGAMPSSMVSSVTATVRVLSPINVCNSVQIYGQEADPDPKNNTALECTIVSTATFHPADINRDRRIDAKDQLELLKAWRIDLK